MKLTKEEKKLRAEERRKKKWVETHKTIDDVDYKICSKCNEWYPSTSDYFYPNKSNSIDGLHPYCKECAVKSAVKWIKSNPEKYKTAIKKQNIKPKNKEKRKKSEQRRREEGKFLEWQQENKVKSKQYRVNRQHKKHEITSDEWIACKDYFNNQCAYCGLHSAEHFIKHRNKIILGDFHKEHVNHKGANDLSNCIPACKGCNSSKHNFPLEEWYSINNPIFNEHKLTKIRKWLDGDYLNYLS